MRSTLIYTETYSGGTGTGSELKLGVSEVKMNPCMKGAYRQNIPIQVAIIAGKFGLRSPSLRVRSPDALCRRKIGHIDAGPKGAVGEKR